MNAEFNWWLLIVGLVVGAGLVWYVVIESRRREVDVDDAERPREAAWLAATMADEGYDVTPDTAERFLELHRRYLEAPAPDDPLPPEPVETADAEEDEGLAQTSPTMTGSASSDGSSTSVSDTPNVIPPA